MRKHVKQVAVEQRMKKWTCDKEESGGCSGSDAISALKFENVGWWKYGNI